MAERCIYPIGCPLANSDTVQELLETYYQALGIIRESSGMSTEIFGLVSPTFAGGITKIDKICKQVLLQITSGQLPSPCKNCPIKELLYSQ